MRRHRLHAAALCSRSLAGLLLLTLVSAPAAAQSLGEVARREQARRAATAKGKVYTNDSLPEPLVPEPAPVRRDGGVPQGPRSDAASGNPEAAAAGRGTPAEPGAKPQAGSEPAAPDASKPAPSKADAKKDEATWRERMTKARGALSRDESFAEALQSRINALSADFVNRDDPAQRAVIGADRDKALAELERVKRDIQNHQKGIAAIREEARREGVPPGWVR